MVTKVAFRTAMRAAAISLVEGFIAQAGSPWVDVDDKSRIQLYRTIPTTFHPPCYFVERITEVQQFTGPTQRQRSAVARVVVLWRLFNDTERGDAVDQLDAFLDGFSDYVLTNYHEPGPTELISSARIEDDPYWVTRDQKTGEQRTYYAGLIALEGYTGN